MNKWNYETHALMENKKVMGFIIVGKINKTWRYEEKYNAYVLVINRKPIAYFTYTCGAILLRYGNKHSLGKLILYTPTEDNLLNDKELLSKLEDIILKGV